MTPGHDVDSSAIVTAPGTGPKPRGYRAVIQFRATREGLRFPTELRYDTFRAVSLSRIVPTRASIRNYTNYRITRVDVEQETGDQVRP